MADRVLSILCPGKVPVPVLMIVEAIGPEEPPKYLGDDNLRKD